MCGLCLLLDYSGRAENTGPGVLHRMSYCSRGPPFHRQEKTLTLGHGAGEHERV